MVDPHPPNDRQSKSRIPEGDISGFISANYPGARWEAIEFACDRIEQSLQKGNYVLPLMVADNFKISSHKDALFTIGELIFESLMIVIQFAVPPLISGPYEGIQLTSLFSRTPA